MANSQGLCLSAFGLALVLAVTDYTVASEHPFKKVMPPTL